MDKKSEVLELAREGLTNREISNRTGVPKPTVSRWILDDESRLSLDWDIRLSRDWLRRPLRG